MVDDGVEDFLADLEKYAEAASDENIKKVLKAGADMFVSDVRRLPKPRSQINSGRHTHMLDKAGYKESSDSLLIGWGAYYGRMVEKGTKKMRAQPHLIPQWEKGSQKYYKAMSEKLTGG